MGHQREHEHGASRQQPRRDDSAAARTPDLAPGLGNVALQRLFRGAISRFASEGGPVDETVGRAIEAARGGGHQLDPAARPDLESALGEDFSEVRLHTDATADHLSRAVEATAFTTGSDIFFRSGAYEPLSSAGRKLLAHELTHVVQQRGAPPAQELRVTDPGDASEREAEAIAEQVARFPASQVPVERVGLQRQGSTGSRAQGSDRAFVGRVVSPAAFEALALQRAIGNRATMQVIQRRLPDFAAVSPEIMGASPEALVAEKKFKQVIKRTIEAMRERDAAVVADAVTRFVAQHQGVYHRRLLDEDLPLGDVDKSLLGDLMTALQAAQHHAQREHAEVAYPRPDVRTGPPTGPQEVVLRALVRNALSTMANIAAGDHTAAVWWVFGSRVADAEKVFGESAIALARLFSHDNIIVDTRGDQTAVHAAGLTNKDRMALSPEVLAAATPENQVKIIHESTHAIDNATTDDAYVDLTPGSPFLNATEDQKVRRAPYYEELARGVLRIRVLPVFTPGGNVVAQASPPQAAVEQMVTRAWTVAINARDRLLDWARIQTTPMWTGQDDATMKQLGTQLANLSRALGLTIHHRMPANGYPPLVGDLDLTIAEDRAAQLSKLIGKAKNFTAQDTRTGTTWLLGKSTHEHLVDLILQQVVATHGHSRKDAAKEEAMIRALASVYDTGRERRLMAAVPAPLAGYYG